MKNVLAAVIALSPLAAAAAPVIVQLTVSNAGCKFDLAVNGVPLAKDDTSDGLTQPINMWLKGAGNAVELKVAPKEKACRLEAKVSEGERELSKADASGDKPTTLKLDFDSKIDALGPWLAAEPLKDEKALKAYAVKLADLVRAGQGDAFVKEAAPKYAELAKAFGVEPAMLSGAEKQALQDFKKVLPKLTAADVVAEPLLGGRLFRLRHAKHKSALFVVKSADSERSFDVVVGGSGGALKVVR